MAVCGCVCVGVCVGGEAVWVSVHLHTPASVFGILAMLCLWPSLDNISLAFHILIHWEMICKYHLFLLTVTSFQLSCPWSCLRTQLYCSNTSRWWIHTGSRFWSCRERQHRGRSEGLFSATVPSGREPHYGPSSCPQAPRHPPPSPPPPAAPADCDASCSAASIRPGGHVRGTKADCHHTQTKSKSEFLSAVPSWLSRLAWSRALRSIINVFSFLGCIKSCAWMHRFCFVCFLFCRVLQVW